MTGLQSADVLSSIARVGWSADRAQSGVRRGRVGRQRLAAARWLLLLAVLAGLFGMHVLTAESATGGHGALPPVTGAGHLAYGASTGGHPGDQTDGSAAVPTALPAGLPATHRVTAVGGQSGVAATAGPAMVVMSAKDPGGMPEGHSGLGGCVLFLVIGGAAVLLGLLSGRAHAEVARAVRTPATARWGRWRRRGPPVWNRPRVALCVIRV